MNMKKNTHAELRRSSLLLQIVIEQTITRGCVHVSDKVVPFPGFFLNQNIADVSLQPLKFEILYFFVCFSLVE